MLLGVNKIIGTCIILRRNVLLVHVLYLGRHLNLIMLFCISIMQLYRFHDMLQGEMCINMLDDIVYLNRICYIHRYKSAMQIIFMVGTFIFFLFHGYKFSSNFTLPLDKKNSGNVK